MKSSKLYLTLLIGLVSLFLLYAFYNLGSKKSPQTYETYNHVNMSTSFKFEKPTKIDEVCYYVLVHRYADFKIEMEENQKLINIYEHHSEQGEKVNFPYSFQWHCDAISPVFTEKLKMTLTKGQMMLGEVRFRQEGQIIDFISSSRNLNDERNIAVSHSFYDNMIFDEVYHARSAYEILKDIFPIYENTHPYLGKLLIASGIEAFGMNPFGWRFSSVIFAIFFIFVMYYFALKLFNRHRYAFVASFLLTHSFMHLAESRVALLNTFGVLFVVISYLFLYLFIKKQKLLPLLLSGLFFGLASAVKWTAVFAGFGFILIAIYLLATKYPLEKRFTSYKLILYGLLSHALLALSVYFLTFYDLYLTTGEFKTVLDYQANMFSYHAGFVPEHSYSSPWWSWAFDLRPVSFHRWSEGINISSISTFGNPAIFWVGIVAILYLMFLFIKKRTLEGSFILFAYLSLYLPHILISRPMFLYHYYYALPFLILAIVYGMKDFLNHYPKYTLILWVYLSIVAGLFLLFYPVLTGYGVSQSYIDTFLSWLPSWWL